MLDGSDILLNADYNSNRDEYRRMANKIVYTGMIDSYFGYCLGCLEYRSLRFETERLKTANYQGNAVVNYTDTEPPYTRIIEHKHFTFAQSPVTYITKEYPMEWEAGAEPYYPVNDAKNQNIFAQYLELAEKEKDVIFGGRLAQYKYYDMDTVISRALAAAVKEFKN